jgi:hypothetical protein
MTDNPARPVSDTAPCVGCGLCCDGTLYDRAKVAPGEESVLTALGLELEHVAERTYFRLPCRFQSCGRCTNYEDRWTVCRSFRCALLRRYQAGEIGVDEARTTVETALGLIDAVRAHDPAAVVVGERRRLRRRFTDDVQSGTAADPGSTARRLLNIIALDTFLERWFRNKKAGAGAGNAPQEDTRGDATRREGVAEG